MKIAYMSDIHLEFGSLWQIELPEADVLVLAGDVCEVRHLEEYADQLKSLMSKYPHTLMVPGNHEFYRAEYNQALAGLRKFYGPKMLHNQVVELDGIKFAGGTLWTSMNNDDVMTKVTVQMCMNDYRQIKVRNSRGDYRHLTPNETVVLHRQAVAFFEDNIDENTVVITHHMPLMGLQSAKYSDHIMNGAYGSDLSRLIEGKSPIAWIFGHTHSAVDMIHGKTRILANPRGYFDYEPQANTFKVKVLEI